MDIAILATGDEIVKGDVVNTNAAEIAKQLTSEGLLVKTHLIAGDDQSLLIQSIGYLLNDHDVIISIGGLGPTSDDKTRFAFAEYCALPLVESHEAYSHVSNLVIRAGRKMHDGQKQQTLFPESATLFPNPWGSALGCYFKWDGKHIFWLPGPPQECLPMFADYLIPIVRKFARSNKKLYFWQLFGVSEGDMAAKLDNALGDLSCTTGYRIDVPYLEFKVLCEPSLVEEVNRRVDPIVSPYIICGPKQKAHQLLVDYIKTNKIHINIKDEATGGALESLILTPESHPYIRFNLEGDILFHLKGLHEYWNGQQSAQNTIELFYQLPNTSRREMGRIPFLGSHWIRAYAVEWCCYKMKELLNQ